jgi:hypothetical protein
MKETQNHAHFSKIPIQNIVSNLYGKNEEAAFTEMNFIQKRRKILTKDQSFQRTEICPKRFRKFRLFKLQKWSKMAKIVISYPFTGNFFQTENTKCTIIEQNRLIACQTQEKTKKCVGLAS